MSTLRLSIVFLALGCYQHHLLPSEERAMDASADGPIEDATRDVLPSEDSSTDVGSSEDGSVGMCESMREPVFPSGSLEGRTCRTTIDCRGRDEWLVCNDGVCSACTDDRTCSRGYFRVTDTICSAEGQCQPARPFAMGECNTSEDCGTGSGDVACVEGTCLPCCSDDECSAGRMGICLDDGTCAYPIAP